MRFERAVVIGGSISGLLSAKVLSNKFREVFVIEKDALNSDSSHRRGVAQTEQPHVLLVKGYRLLEKMLPGIGTTLRHAGAIEVDWATDYYIYYGGHGWNKRSTQPTEITSFSSSRSLLETCIREKVQSVDNISFLKGTKVVGLEADQALEKVTGVKAISSNKLTTSIDADLVVDTSGRNSKLPQWLSSYQWEIPKEVCVDPYLGYSTCRFKIPDNKKIPWKVLTYPHVAPKYNRKAYLAKIENNELIATIGGYCRDYPPSNIDDFFDFASELQNDEFFKIICECKPISKVFAYKETSNIIRHYNQINMPSGLIVLGDAYCALCPSYGQGMTCSAISADTLMQWIERQINSSQDCSTKDFQISLAKSITPQWDIAIQQDFGFITTTSTDASIVAKAQRMSKFPLSLINIYIDRLIAGTTIDCRLNKLFIQIINILKPPASFFSPRTVLLVLISLNRIARKERI